MTAAPLIRLVGFEEADPRPGDHRLIARAFERLPGLAPEDRVTRLIGYEWSGSGGAGRFIGAEAAADAELPAGAAVWELGEDVRRVHVAEGDEQTEPIAWRWRERPAAPPGRWIGEFEAAGRVHRLFAAAPVVADGGLDDAVRLVEYDPGWPASFEAMAGELREALGPDVALRVEHYGSTAVPGMPAKPVVDVLVEAPSFEAARRRCIPRLAGERWEYWWYMDHLVFIRRERLLGRRTHHVHVAPAGHRVWEGLAFRDRLRRDPAARAEYVALKHRLAAAHGSDREAYTAAKAALVARLSQP